MKATPNLLESKVKMLVRYLFVIILSLVFLHFLIKTVNAGTSPCAGSTVWDGTVCRNAYVVGGTTVVVGIDPVSQTLDPVTSHTQLAEIERDLLYKEYGNVFDAYLGNEFVNPNLTPNPYPASEATAEEIQAIRLQDAYWPTISGKKARNIELIVNQHAIQSLIDNPTIIGTPTKPLKAIDYLTKYNGATNEIWSNSSPSIDRQAVFKKIIVVSDAVVSVSGGNWGGSGFNDLTVGYWYNMRMNNVWGIVPYDIDSRWVLNDAYDINFLRTIRSAPFKYGPAADDLALIDYDLIHELTHHFPVGDVYFYVPGSGNGVTIPQTGINSSKTVGLGYNSVSIAPNDHMANSFGKSLTAFSSYYMKHFWKLRPIIRRADYGRMYAISDSPEGAGEARYGKDFFSGNLTITLRNIPAVSSITGCKQMVEDLTTHALSNAPSSRGTASFASNSCTLVLNRANQEANYPGTYIALTDANGIVFPVYIPRLITEALYWSAAVNSTSSPPADFTFPIDFTALFPLAIDQYRTQVASVSSGTVALNNSNTFMVFDSINSSTIPSNQNIVAYADIDGIYGLNNKFIIKYNGILQTDININDPASPDGPVSYPAPASYVLDWRNDFANTCSVTTTYTGPNPTSNPGIWNQTSITSPMTGTKSFSNIPEGQYIYNISCTGISSLSATNNTTETKTDTLTVNVTATTACTSPGPITTAASIGATSSAGISAASVTPGNLGDCLVPGFFGALYYNKPSGLSNIKDINFNTAQPAYYDVTSSINYDWAAASPFPGYINTNDFAVLWRGKFNFAVGGDYIFTNKSNNGMRMKIFVDIGGGQTNTITVWDNWDSTNYNEVTQVISLPPGTHTVQVEYYEIWEGALAKAIWQKSNVTCESIPTDQFCVQYYNNTNLTGIPVFKQNENLTRTIHPNIGLSHIWGTGGPGNGVNNDNFSAVWQGKFNFESGNHRFIINSNNGMRLYVDNVLVVNDWGSPHSTRARFAYHNVTGGIHTIKVEYYESLDDAVAEFYWDKEDTVECTPNNTPTGSFCAEYYPNNSLSDFVIYKANESLTRPTPPNVGLGHVWGTGGPGNSVPTNNFSARWEGKFNFDNGSYKFITNSDDAIRLYLDNVLVINAWTAHATRVDTADINVSAGVHTVKVEYFENTGNATAEFYWDKNVTANTPPVITNEASAPTTVMEGNLYSFDLNATDAENNTLTYYFTSSPAGMTINSSTGLINWTAPGYITGSSNVYFVSTTVSDGLSTDFAGWFITVQQNPANQKPVFTSTPNSQVVMQTAYQYAISANDPDGGAVTYSLVTNPAGMTISGNTVNWTPTVDQAHATCGTQNYTVVIRATDNENQTTDQAYQLGVRCPYGLVRVDTNPVDINGTKVIPRLFDGLWQWPNAYVIHYETNTPVTFILEFENPTNLVGFKAHSGTHWIVKSADSWNGSRTTLVNDGNVVSTVDQYAHIPFASKTAKVFEITFIRREYDGVVHAAEIEPLFGSGFTSININTVPDQLATPGTEWRKTVGITYSGQYPNVLFCTKTSGPANLTVVSGVTLNDTCQMRWTPSASNLGDNYVTIRVYDSAGHEDTETFKITVID